MEVTRKDSEFWKVFKDFYKDNRRQENQLEAYWCRPAGDNQELFNVPKQRIFARFLRSYLNTTWHKISLTCEQRESLFSDECIIQHAVPKIKSIIDEKSDPPKGLQNLLNFCVEIVELVGKLDFEVYGFQEEQTKNFEILSTAVKDAFEEKKKKNLPVSKYERIIYENLDEPCRTIMKMQKLLPGLGVALTCDFLKEAHLYNIAKPDVHICHVFSLMDGIPYSMDLTLVKRVSEFADAVCKADSNDFCNSGAYNVDKIVWMNCSDYDTDGDHEKKMSKDKFLKKLAEVVKAQKTGPDALQKQDRPFA